MRIVAERATGLARHHDIARSGRTARANPSLGPLIPDTTRHRPSATDKDRH